MANFATSDLTTAQAKLTGAFANQEVRFRTPVTHLEFLRQSSIMLPSYEELRKRDDRVIDTFFTDRVSRALGSERVFNHSGTKGTSTKFTPSWLTNTDKFAISLKQGDQNMFDNGEMLAQEMQNVMVNMIEGMDADAESHIFSNRSTENLATQQGTFEATDHHFAITEATEGDRAIQITQTVMDTNKFSGPITLFCDSISHDKFEKQRFQGAGNAENLTFQFNNNVKIIHSLGMDAFAAALATPVTKGFWVAVVDGTICALPWIPKQNRAGIITNVNQYGSIINPIDSLTLATHSYNARADETSTNGFQQDVRTEWEISVDVALDNAPFNFTGSEPTSSLLAFGLV